MNEIEILLKQIGYSNLRLIGKGMESYVFEIDKERVLKVYSSDSGIENLLRLKVFYESLNTSSVDFTTPIILDVQSNISKHLVVEKKLQGICPSKDTLRSLSNKSLKIFLNNYVDTLFSIQKISTSFLQNSEPLDLTGRFFQNKKYTSWNELLVSNLELKSLVLKEMFSKKVRNFEEIVKSLVSQIDGFQIGNYSLIHGDFFPANCMVDDNLKITAILDFGILTTIGDPIFDIALGGFFSDMFGEITTFDIRAYVLNTIIDRLDSQLRKRLYLYLLVYSIISANIYAKNDPEDGHFLWCASNLCNPNYLKFL